MSDIHRVTIIKVMLRIIFRIFTDKYVYFFLFGLNQQFIKTLFE